MINEESIRWGLEELADRREQEELWLGTRPSEMSSFEEAVCRLFDDAGLTRALDSGFLAKRYSIEFSEKVAELDRAISLVPTAASPEQQLNHPGMDRIRRLARELLNMLSEESAAQELGNDDE